MHSASKYDVRYFINHYSYCEVSVCDIFTQNKLYLSNIKHPILFNKLALTWAHSHICGRIISSKNCWNCCLAPSLDSSCSSDPGKYTTVFSYMFIMLLHIYSTFISLLCFLVFRYQFKNTQQLYSKHSVLIHVHFCYQCLSIYQRIFINKHKKYMIRHLVSFNNTWNIHTSFVLHNLSLLNIKVSFFLQIQHMGWSKPPILIASMHKESETFSCL